MTATKRLNWSFLRHGRCPACSFGFLTDLEGGTFACVRSVAGETGRGCGFSIGKRKAEWLIASMPRQGEHYSFREDRIKAHVAKYGSEG